MRTNEAPAAAGGAVYLKTILGVALGLRLAVVAGVLVSFPHGWLFRSQGELGFLAESLLAGKGMSSPFGGETGPTAFLAPAYPVVIAAVFRVFGNFTTASAVAVMLLQTAFCVAAIWLIVRVARREFGATAANVAGFFWAVGLPFLWLQAIFWDTSLTILLLIGAIALALRVVREPSVAIWAAMGVWGGVTMLVNPSFLLVLAGIFGWAVFPRGSAGWRGPMVAVVLAAAIFAPWPIRNARVFHAFIPLRSNLGFELWKGNRSGATSIDDPGLFPVTNRAEYADYARKGEVAYMRDKGAEEKEYIREHPGVFVRLTAERVVRFWTGTGTANASWLLASFSVVTTVLGAMGVWWLIRSGRGDLAVLLCLPLVVFPLPYYVTHAELRFRIVIEPVTTLLAAYAVGEWGRMVRERRLGA